MNNIRICARGLLVDNNRIYLINEDTRQNVNCWFLPGGKIEIGESISDGLKRELSEEIGLKKSDIKFNDEFLGLYTFYLKSGDINVNLTFEVEFPIPDSVKDQGESKVVEQKLVQKNEVTNYLADSITDQFKSNVLPNI